MTIRVAVVGLAVLCLAPGMPAAEEAPTVRVTGRLMSVNGHAEVPVGLFGVHALKLDSELIRDWGIECYRQIHFGPGSKVTVPEKGSQYSGLKMFIDCQGDRYCPAVSLTDPDYKEACARWGREFAEKCKAAGWTGWLEIWNEPYLNWAERSRGDGRNHYHPRWYDVEKAAEGGPVTIKGRTEPLKHLRWRRLWAKDEKGKIAPLMTIPEGLKAGDTFRGRQTQYWTDNQEQTFTVVEEWHPYDPTAVSFWSGKQNYDFYMWMLLPWAKAVKETNPGVQVLAGWDFHINSNDWAAWEILYKPMIDEAARWIDGVTEHHYGSDSRMTAGTYEVVVAYGVTEHGKWLHLYNTETAGCVDPAVPGGRHGKASPLGAFNYGLRDITELIYRCPDKAASRTAHGSKTAGWGGGGDEFLFKLLKDLRGPLVETASTDLDVWPVASVNGDRLVVVIYNDHRQGRRVTFQVAAPPGTTLSDGHAVWVEPTEPKGPLAFEEAQVCVNRSGRMELGLRPRSGMKLVFPLKGKVPEQPQLERRQFFAKGILKRIEPGRPVTLAVKVDADVLARAESARLRMVLEKVKGGQGRVKVNGAAVALPDHDWITDVPLDPKWLGADTTLVFETTGDGYQVDMASVVLDAPVK